MANFDAGNFNLNFGVGGPNRFQKAPGPAPKPGNEKKIEEPRDGVDLGSLPFLQVNPEVLPADPVNDAPIIAGAGTVARSESVSSPGLLDLNTIGSVENKFQNLGTGITALNGLNSTSLVGLNGVTIASVNPLQPVKAPRVPTTSVATNGLDSMEFVTVGGKVIGGSEPLAVRMPTTSVTTFGLQDTEWLTTSGRTISL
jgi:hypothetical protein